MLGMYNSFVSIKGIKSYKNDLQVLYDPRASCTKQSQICVWNMVCERFIRVLANCIVWSARKLSQVFALGQLQAYVN